MTTPYYFNFFFPLFLSALPCFSIFVPRIGEFLDLRRKNRAGYHSHGMEAEKDVQRKHGNLQSGKWGNTSRKEKASLGKANTHL